MRLPMVITGAFDLLMVELFAKQVVFAIDHTETYSPAQLKKVANIVNEQVEKWMEYLQEQGVLSGHVRGEYV